MSYELIGKTPLGKESDPKNKKTVNNQCEIDSIEQQKR